MPYIPPVVAETSQSLRLAQYLGPPQRGKVRDIYDLDEYLLIVTTDRVSAYDHVLSSHINNKGAVLNGLAVWWFTSGLSGFAHHMEAYGPDIDEFLRRSEIRRDPDLQARSMVVRKCKPEPIEFVIRGYLTGSGWKDYQQTGAVCGVRLPQGLRDGDKLETPIFTPATKADTGHDENVTEAEAAELLTFGPESMALLKGVALKAYEVGRKVAASRGIILADTKFEMDGNGVLIDEVLTPDSSRYWSLDAWQALQDQNGGTPPSFDKQVLRNYLEPLKFAQMSDEEAAKVVLPTEIRQGLTEVYEKLLERLTTFSLPEFQREFVGIAE